MTKEEAIKWLKNCALTECEDCKYINEPDAWCDVQVMRIARMFETLPDDLVRCKDCRHAYFKDFDKYCPYVVGALKPDGYCHHGERREPDKCE